MVTMTPPDTGGGAYATLDTFAYLMWVNITYNSLNIGATRFIAWTYYNASVSDGYKNSFEGEMSTISDLKIYGPTIHEFERCVALSSVYIPTHLMDTEFFMAGVRGEWCARN